MDDRRPIVLPVTIASLAAATVFVILRFISRVVIVQRLGLHDHFMLLAWAISFGFCFAVCYGTSKGLGLHEKDIPQDWHAALNKTTYAFSVLYNPALMATKTSILIFYLHLMAREKTFRGATYVTLFAVNAAGLALTLLNVFRCNPVRAAFTYPPPAGARCTDLVTLYLSSAPANIITDLAIFFLPLPVLTRMQLPLKQKIILIVTFSFGAFVAVVDVVRIAYLQSASIARIQAMPQFSGTRNEEFEDDDFSFHSSFALMWSAVEVNVGIICACVPSLKPLVARVIPRLIRDTGEYSAPDGTQDQSHRRSTIAQDQPRQDYSLQTLKPVSNGYPRATKDQSQSNEDINDPVDMMEFLTMPGTVTNINSGNSRSRQKPAPFFDFVNLRKPKSMLKMSNRESIPAIAMVTVLFFLWGFAYGLLDVLNSQFQLLVDMTTVQLTVLHAAYFCGYIIGPIGGRLILKRWGYKSVFSAGLCLWASGVLVFWPSAVLASFEAFLMSNLIVGCGLAVVETAANPFIALCGPEKYSEVRLNIAQGFQAIGVVVSPLLAKKVLFRNSKDAASLIDAQWTYLGIAFFDVLLAVAFHYLPIPEASDDELVELANRRREANAAKIGKVRVVYVTLGLGVMSQWFYMSGQESMNMNFEKLIEFIHPDSRLTPFDLSLVGHTVFALGRFMTAFAQLFAKPRLILLFLFIGMIITSILSMNVEGSAGVSIGILVFLFQSGAFGLIFAISLRGMGRHTKTAGALLTAGISGGAIFPFIQNTIASRRGIQYSFVTQVVAFSSASIFALYLNLVPAARRQVDLLPDEYVQRPQHRRILGLRSRFNGEKTDESHSRHHRRSLNRQRESSPEPSSGQQGLMHDLAPWPTSSPTRDDTRSSVTAPSAYQH